MEVKKRTRNTEPVEIPVQPQKVFALLLIVTEDGKTLMRPIGGEWENGINDAIEQTDKQYPDCRMKILEENYRGWNKYFAPNGVPKERVLL